MPSRWNKTTQPGTRPYSTSAECLSFHSPGLSWALLGSPGPSWALLRPSGTFRALLGPLGPSWALPGSPGPSWALLGSTGRSWALLGPPDPPGSFWAFPGPFQRDLLAWAFRQDTQCLNMITQGSNMITQGLPPSQDSHNTLINYIILPPSAFPK